MSGLRIGAYRVLQRRFLGPLLRASGALPEAPELPAQAELWAHAASAGELETLWPVLEAWMAAAPEMRVHVSVFSPSAKTTIESLRSRRMAGITFSSAPWEGEWSSAFDQVRPRLFLTAKYEAWPDLWAALSERDIPFLVLAAQPRDSLDTAARLSRILGTRLPELWFSALQESGAQELRAKFPSARVEVHGDPRFDRVRARLENPSARARELAAILRDYPRGAVLGSVWPEDLPFLESALKETHGILVPHDVDAESVERFAQVFAGRAHTRSSRLHAEDGNVPQGWILVDERGVLAELYSCATHVYIGGGFSKGVHSVVEPAFQGVPVACGPKNAELFPEIEALERLGQLTRITSPDALRAWNEQARGSSPRPQWREAAQARCGASQRVLPWIQERIRGTVGTS